MSKNALTIRGLGKRYDIGAAAQRHNSFRDLLVDKLKSFGKKEKKSQFWALNNASFDVQHGENVGIIGLNGAGKSTLLKILSRITEPTAGSALINGRVGALLEVGTGFHAELTGRENVFLYGSILGMHKEEIERKFDAIVEFSGIEKFIDTPVKRYSSGMYVRLAFSVAANLEPDILLLDEVLAVGDLAFQRKCIDHAKELQKRDATILFVSHNMFSIKTMCQRVIYLRKGEVQYDGPVEGGIELYEKDCRMTELSWTGTKPEEWPIYITGCELSDERGNVKSMFDFGERMTIKLNYNTRQAVKNPNFIVAFIRSDGVAVCNFNPETDGVSMGVVDEPGTLTVHLPPIKLIAEMYSIWIIIREPGLSTILSGQIATTFHVRHPLFNMHFGTFHEEAVKWEFSSAGAPALVANASR